MKVSTYRSILYHGKKWLFPYNKLKVTGLQDVYLGHLPTGAFYGIEYLELYDNNHNGIFKNFGCDNSLMNLFPDVNTLILRNSYHPLDIKWINKFKFQIFVPDTLNTYNLLNTIDDKNRICIKHVLPQIKHTIKFT